LLYREFYGKTCTTYTLMHAVFAVAAVEVFAYFRQLNSGAYQVVGHPE
jgi:hypothetical protein